PVWEARGRAFFVATNVGRDTTAISRYDADSREWAVVVDSDRELACDGDDAGRWLLVHANEDGYSRLALHDARQPTEVAEVPLRVLRRRARAGVPLGAGRRRAVPGRRDGARRARVPVPAGIPPELHAAHTAPGLARLRSRSAKRPRLDGVREAVRAPGRRAA